MNSKTTTKEETNPFPKNFPFHRFEPRKKRLVSEEKFFFLSFTFLFCNERHEYSCQDHSKATYRENVSRILVLEYLVNGSDSYSYESRHILCDLEKLVKREAKINTQLGIIRFLQHFPEIQIVHDNDDTIEIYWQQGQLIVIQDKKTLMTMHSSSGMFWEVLQLKFEKQEFLFDWMEMDPWCEFHQDLFHHVKMTFTHLFAEVLVWEIFHYLVDLELGGFLWID